MIGRLSGVLLEKQAPYLLVDVNGVGYEVQAPMTSIYPLPEVGGELVLYTHLSVSENAHQLFGFYSLEERRLFRTLIKVNGVGPKMALAILSSMPVDDFVVCVRQDQVATLVKVPGVGRKTAERLIIEVKDRLADWETESASGSTQSVEAIPRVQTLQAADVINEAESALIALGYKPVQASKMIAEIQLPPEQIVNESSESLIRLALQRSVL